MPPVKEGFSGHSIKKLVVAPWSYENKLIKCKYDLKKGLFMKKIFSIEHALPKVDNSILEGLAPVVCYEPWFPRCLEAIKQCLSDGFPVLLRFHSAASYPNAPADGYKMDLESHAVLVVGYDDEKQSVAIVDP